MVGRRFADGVNLSGGEWERVALGRAYLRDAHPLIFEELLATAGRYAGLFGLQAAGYRQIDSGRSVGARTRFLSCGDRFSERID